jgi:4-methylaminobutanoate oxidase (formaldehyde-forming)
MTDGPSLPSEARVVIVGGGIAGVSIAYHLTKLGWRDVLLIERSQLCSGTTWHAAGLVMQLRASHTLTQLCRYGAKLYAELEAETGQATGFKRCGSLPVARTPERLHEIKRMASIGHAFDVELHVLSPHEIGRHHPLLDTRRVVGGLFIPGDGQTNPVDTTMALAKGARARGARIIEGVSVTGFTTKAGAVTGVRTDHGDVACEVVVNCGGIWARQIGRLAGVNVPLYASEHMYVTTTAMENVSSGLPVIRDTDGYVYIKEDAGKLLVGAFEPEGKPLPLADLPREFSFGELPPDWDHFALPMSRAIELVPALEYAPIRHFMNGPESFTPDNQFIVGAAPELKNFYVAAGFNSQGILSGAGIGLAMAEWIVEGHPTMDLSAIDIARFHPFQGNENYLKHRVRESLGLLYAMHWPHRQMESARPVRQTALHARVAACGACFGEIAGWERANWYVSDGTEPRYEYSYGKPVWYANVAREHRAARENVALFDLSSFAKFRLEGPDAERELNRICCNDVAVEPGRCVYTGMLNPWGGYEADLTVTRLSHDAYLVITAAASQSRDFTWIRRNLRADARAVLTDVTSAYATLAVMGPNSRALLQPLVDVALDNAAFPFATARAVELGYAKALAMRVSYVGELGWELYVPSEYAGPMFDRLLDAGRDHGLALAGYHALDSLRSEKGYRHWGHDITPVETPLEAAQAFTVAFGKESDFIGRAALEKQRANSIAKRLVFVQLDDAEPMLFHDEPIVRDGVIVGRVTSGAFGHTLGTSVGMGYVDVAPHGSISDYVKDGRFEVEIACERFPARASSRPFYDPSSARMRV